MFLKFLFMYINAEARLWLDSRASSLCFLTLKNQFLPFRGLIPVSNPLRNKLTCPTGRYRSRTILVQEIGKLVSQFLPTGLRS